MFSSLSVKEKQVVFEALRASVEGPFFPEWEFQTLFGPTRAAIAEVLRRWPDLDDGNEEVSLAINNSFNNLLGYPHGEDAAFAKYISVTRDEFERIFEKWRQQKS